MGLYIWDVGSSFFLPRFIQRVITLQHSGGELSSFYRALLKKIIMLDILYIYYPYGQEHMGCKARTLRLWLVFMVVHFRVWTHFADASCDLTARRGIAWSRGVCLLFFTREEIQQSSGQRKELAAAAAMRQCWASVATPLQQFTDVNV